MAGRFVPVTLGSPRFDSVDVGPFRVTDARFPPGLVLAPHHHARPIVAVILEGSFEGRFAGRSYDCTPGTLLTEPAEIRHGNRFKRAGARVLVVEPDPAREELMRPCHDLLARAGTLWDEGVVGVARRLASEVHQRDDAAPLAVEGLVLELLARAARREDAGRRHRHPPKWLLEARDALQAGFRGPLRVADVAAAVDVHPVHLARSFRRWFGTSPGDFVRRLRLEWAARELGTEDAELGAVALRAGFSDQSHFTRCFKRYTGRTPGEYRRRRSS